MVFYYLDDQDINCVDYGEGNDWGKVVCSKHEGHQRAGDRITVLHLEILTPKIVDFSWTMLSDIVVSEKAVEIIRANNLMGYELKPVKIVKYHKMFSGNPLPKLWEFIVTGKGGFAHADSGIVVKTKCDACGHVRYSACKQGITVDERQWDGSDFFTVTEYPNYVLVTERVRTILANTCITNLNIIESTQLKWSD